MRPLDLDMIRVFREKFGHIKEEPLVLYGTGEKTRLLIENCPDFKKTGRRSKDLWSHCLG